jgi:small subunit ribosomal protein S7
MPRKREVKKKEILPDPKYHDTMTAKFINGVMRRGKKSSAEGIFYGALDIIKDKTQESRRGYLSSSGRSETGKESRFGHSVDHWLCETAVRKDDERKAFSRTD